MVGFNWGNVDVDGNVLSFVVNKDGPDTTTGKKIEWLPAFEIPLNSVTKAYSTTTNKAEATIEFHAENEEDSDERKPIQLEVII